MAPLRRDCPERIERREENTHYRTRFAATPVHIREETHVMQPGTAHILTALHSVFHGIGLTNEEVEDIATNRPVPRPAAWRGMVRALETAPDRVLDAHLASQVLRWLSLHGDEEFARRYRHPMRETLALDRERLAEVAHVLAVHSDVPAQHFVYSRMLLSEAWSDRARRLRRGGPDGSKGAIAALEQALGLLPFGGKHRRRLLVALIELSEATGDIGRAKASRERLDRIERAECDRSSGHLRCAAVLTALWCMTHRKMLLEHERDLDPEIRSTPKEWDRIRAAAMAGKVEDLPIPTETLRAWALEAMLDRKGLVDCERWAGSALRAVELLWGDSRDGDVSQNAIDQVLVVAASRRETLLAEYRPPSDAVPNVWYEAHQGAQSRDAKSRVAILRKLDWMLSRSLDPWVLACVALDRAAEHEATGRHAKVRWHLDKAVRLTQSLEDAKRREVAPLALATWMWRCGEAEDAKELLAGLSGESARDVTRQVEDRAAARDAIVCAERVHGKHGDVESWSALALAHLDAGHGVVAERLAGELCATHPEEALAWETRARVRHGNARYLAALDPAVKASELADDVAPARSLLARVFARLGKSWREHAGSIAAAAIEYCEQGQALPVDELEELAEVCYRAEIFDWARRGDDLVWSRRTEREPSAEWLGAAVARRCHGRWADDAPEWLGRLSEAGSKALARWTTERVESLQHWCDLIDRQVLAPATWRSPAPELTPAAREILAEAENLSIRAQARTAALRAASGLGYERGTAQSVLGEPVHLGDRADESRKPVERWTIRLATIEALFGPRIAIALRASETAQQAWGRIRTDRPNGAALVIREMFQDEKLAWIRWAEERPVLKAMGMDEVAGLTPLTRERLGTLRVLARYSDEELRRAEWNTRWTDLDRW